MSKLKKAVELSFEKWVEEIDKGYIEALERGELPHKTEEEKKQHIKKILQLKDKE
jgi:hypothetical protein